MCGAKEGDYFTLEGEMMYLPPGQGISIYSLGKWDYRWAMLNSAAGTIPSPADRGASIRLAPAGSEAARDARQRLDDLGRAGCLPRPKLQV